KPALLLSLRRIAHSTSLRAAGSVIARCSSVAWEDLPLRASPTAVLTRATSSAEAGPLYGTVVSDDFEAVLPAFGSDLASLAFLDLASLFFASLDLGSLDDLSLDLASL